MTLTVKAGTSDYFVALSTATTGATGSETPDGDVVYLFAEDFTLSFKEGQAAKPSVAGRSFRYPNGKRAMSVDLTNCIITAQVTASATAELNAILDFIYDNSNKIGAGGVYCFIKNIAESNAYIKLSWNTSGTPVQYLKGYVDVSTVKGEKGKMYRIPSLKVVEATN